MLYKKMKRNETPVSKPEFEKIDYSLINKNFLLDKKYVY